MKGDLRLLRGAARFGRSPHSVPPPRAVGVSRPANPRILTDQVGSEALFVDGDLKVR
jgi:hypothetical protein